MSVTFDLTVLVRFPFNPCFIRWYSWFLLQNISSVYRRRLSLLVALERAHSAQVRGGRRGHTGVKKSFADSRPKLFWSAIYCANLKSDAGYQSGSRSRRGLMSISLLIMCEQGCILPFWNSFHLSQKVTRITLITVIDSNYCFFESNSPQNRMWYLVLNELGI